MIRQNCVSVTLATSRAGNNANCARQRLRNAQYVTWTGPNAVVVKAEVIPMKTKANASLAVKGSLVAFNVKPFRNAASATLKTTSNPTTTIRANARPHSTTKRTSANFVLQAYLNVQHAA